MSNFSSDAVPARDSSMNPAVISRIRCNPPIIEKRLEEQKPFVEVLPALRVVEYAGRLREYLFRCHGLRGLVAQPKMKPRFENVPNSKLSCMVCDCARPPVSPTAARQCEHHDVEVGRRRQDVRCAMPVLSRASR